MDLDSCSGSQEARQGSASAPRRSRSANRVASSDGAPARFLSMRQAAARLGVSLRTFHNLRSEPWMPLPRQLGIDGRVLRWVADELDEAVISRAPVKRPDAGTEPEQLRRGKIEALKARGVSA